MKKLFAFLAITFLTSCSTDGRYQMEGHSNDTRVIDTHTSEVFIKTNDGWVSLGVPAKEAIDR